MIFHAPGKVFTPEFVGVRTGSYSKKLALLAVQVGLPEEPPQDIDGYLVQAARDAISEAERWAAKRGIGTDLSDLQAVLDSDAV